MLLLFEAPAGYAIFKVDGNKLKDPENLESAFSESNDVVKLKAFQPFANTTEAVVAATSIVENTLDKTLKKFLKKSNISDELRNDGLAVADTKLGSIIKEGLAIPCIHNDNVDILMRGIRGQIDSLLGNQENSNSLKSMQLGLSHSLGRYKLKFSADKVDIMIVQAIGLLDDLDKEINMYAMRVREWYGWHFPEMAQITNNNMYYCKAVKKMGMKSNCKNMDFSDIFEDSKLEEDLKKAAETSMGTEISEFDLMLIYNFPDCN